MKVKKKLVFRCFFMISLIVSISATTLWLMFPDWWYDVCVMPFRSSPAVDFRISPGVRASRIAEDLVNEGISVSRGNLIRFMVRSGLDRKLRPGLYSLIPGPSWRVVEQLLNQEPLQFKITLIPGIPLGDYFPFEENYVSRDDEMQLSKSFFPEDMVDLLPSVPVYRAAYLLPETYHLPELNPESLVSQASRLWWNLLGKRMPKASKDVFDLAIKASLVERESLKDEERPVIAGVIENRLKRGMPLQIDATVVYALKLKGRDVKRVSYKDLKVDSPYNTYRIPGLPPSPICIPSAASWKAVLSPDEHGYLYYVADGTGGHVFSRTYEQHRRAIRKVRN